MVTDFNYLCFKSMSINHIFEYHLSETYSDISALLTLPHPSSRGTGELPEFV